MSNNNSSNSASITETIESAAAKFNLCRNRLWEVSRSLNDDDERMLFLGILDAAKSNERGHHEGHEQCTFDFCEHSRLDFTSVSQRHENCGGEVKGVCGPRHFDAGLLDKALEEGRPTAWALDGTATVKRPQPFMSISHVWVDGTGAGAWPPGQAILRMQQNYEDARITLVHDCFLRNWEWVSPEVACLAIALSPWFSRGWTALELARSRKVKVVFRGGVIKDLDEDILAKASTETSAHVIASMVIEGLRYRGIEEVNQLLRVLGPRHTSWPRDVAIISGQLVGVNLRGDYTQQMIYQAVLRKIGKISYENLFHNSVTMSGAFTWCPTSLFSLKQSSRPSSLDLRENGDLVGTWIVSQIPNMLERYNWKDTHPLVQARLQSSLKNPSDHMLLVCPQSWGGTVSAALVVKRLRGSSASNSELEVGFVGPVYFHPPLERGELTHNHIDPTHPESEVRIVSTMERREEAADKRIADNRAAASKYRLSDLLAASAEGDEAKVQLLLREAPKGDVSDLQNSDGNGPLHLAAHQGHAHTLRLLLDAVPDCNIRSDREKKTPLHLAAKNGYLDAVELLLARGADVNIQDGDTWTALHYAVWGCYGAIVHKLLQSAADVLAKDRLGQTGLHLAAERGDAGIARMLLDNSASLTATASDGQTALHRAAWACSAEVIKLLLGAPAPSANQLDINALDLEKRTALHIAADMGQPSIVKILLQHNPATNIQDSKEQTAVHIAAENGYEAVADLLLNIPGTDRELDDHKGLTPLALAAKNGHNGVVKTLIHHGAVVDARGGTGRTPLMWAAAGGHEGVINALIAANADPKATDADGQTPLLFAAEDGSIDGVRLMIATQSDVDLQVAGGRTPLLWAASKGYTDVVRVLLDTKSDIEFKDGTGQTPLGAAAKNGHEDVVRLLLQFGADTEAICRGESHYTALIEAADNGHEGVVRLLIESNANIEAKVGSGLTSLHLAICNGHEAVVRLLLENGAELETPNDLGYTLGYAAFVRDPSPPVLKALLEYGVTLDQGQLNEALSLFAAMGLEEETRLVIEKGAALESRERKKFRTPLHLAVVSGNEAVVRLLLDKGADMGCEDADNMTPIWLAYQNKHMHICKMLIDYDIPLGSMPAASYWLQWAAENGYKRTVELLLERGVDPAFEMENPEALARELGLAESRKTRAQRSPLGIPALNGDVEMLELMLAALEKIHPDKKHEYAVLPLHAGLLNGHAAVLELLLRRGFVAITDVQHYRQWLLKVGSLGGHLDLVELVLKILEVEEIDDLEDMDPDGRTPLSYAAEGGNTAIVQLLLDCGSDIEFVSFQTGRTPIFYAVGNIEVVKLLLEKGADPSVRDNEGRTVFSVAVAQGQKEVVKLLTARLI